MTRWESLGAGAAAERMDVTEVRMGLSAWLGDPPPQPDSRPEAFVQALSMLRLAPEFARRLALEGALEVALGSGTLPLSQNLALGTVAEALGFDRTELATLFEARTRSTLPPPWDPSCKAAWAGRTQGGVGPLGAWDDAVPALEAPGEGSGERPGIVWIKALAVLGLDEGATEEEIRRAFRRISRVHHPDHYASQGAEAVKEADQAFRRIKEAYEFLMKAVP